MTGTPHSSKDRLTGPLVAATMTLMLGAMACSIVLALAGSDPVAAVVLFFSGIGLICMMLWVLRSTPQAGASVYNWVRSRHARPAPLDYEPALRKAARKRYGTNTPPTVEQVRDLKDSPNTWIPHPGDTGRKKLKH